MRSRYNGAVRDLNEAVQRFPAVLIARSLGFSEETYYEVEAAVRDAGAPKVDFSG
jgi:LemA protein